MELRSNSQRVPKEPATTTFAYDAWGQMTSKSQGGYSALYAYGAAHRLYTVTSDFPGEGNVTYITGGDGKRRERTDASGTTQYKWDMGWNVINEENGAGTLQRTYVGHTMAHVDGSDPAYGTWNYYFHDHLGSTRRLRDASKTSVAAYEYMPYGQVYAASGTATATTHTYAMLAWDDTAGMYFAPFRYYMPEAGRWTQRDPLGMVDGTNVFAYVGGNPTRYGDALGVCREDGESFSDCKARMMREEYELVNSEEIFLPILDGCLDGLFSIAGGGAIIYAAGVETTLTIPVLAIDNAYAGAAMAAANGGSLQVTVVVSAGATAASAAIVGAGSYYVARRYLRPHTNAWTMCAFKCNASEWFQDFASTLDDWGLI